MKRETIDLMIKAVGDEVVNFHNGTAYFDDGFVPHTSEMNWAFSKTNDELAKLLLLDWIDDVKKYAVSMHKKDEISIDWGITENLMRLMTEKGTSCQG